MSEQRLNLEDFFLKIERYFTQLSPNVNSYLGTGAVTMTRHTERRTPLAAVGVGCTAVAV